MTELEKHELGTRIKAMDPEEVTLALKCIDTSSLFAELVRRDAEYSKAIKAVREAVKVFN